MKYLVLVTLLSCVLHAADTVAIALVAGTTKCVVAITVDVADAKTTLLASTLKPAQALQYYQRDVLQRAALVLSRGQTSAFRSDADIDADTARSATDASTEADAIKAARPTLNGDPAK